MHTWFWTAGVGIIAAFLAVYFAVACTVGFGPRDAHWEGYGETPVDGPVRQPVCFWTDLGFVAAGLAVLLWLDCTASTARGTMAAATALSVPLGLLMVWMGPGSMLEHGTLNRTWGWFDASSIHWFSLYVVGFVILRWIPGADQSWLGRGLFWAAFVLCAVGIGVWTRLDPRAALPWSIGLMALMGVMLVVSVILERTGNVEYIRPWDLWALPVAAAFLIAGIVFLLTSGRGSSISKFGHGMWHISVAAASFFVYVYLRTERPR